MKTVKTIGWSVVVLVVVLLCLYIMDDADIERPASPAVRQGDDLPTDCTKSSATDVPNSNLLPGFSSGHVNTRLVQVNVDGGSRAMMAIQIGSDDFSAATWTAFNPRPIITLPDQDGKYEIYFDIKDTAGYELITKSEVILDRLPPVLTILTPAGAQVSQPVIQIKGTASEELSQLTFDAVNANGTVLGEKANVLESGFNPTTGLFARIDFQCFDVDMASGVNTIRLHATDLAGNVSETVLSLTYNPALDTNAPVISLTWPQAGQTTRISGDQFTLRGLVDDFTASVMVSGLTETPVAALVERDGRFWVEDLPLTAGIHTGSVVATDVSGNVSAKAVFTVEKSAVNIEITKSVTQAEMRQGVGTIQGTINVSGYDIWVNGVLAVVNCPAGAWTASGVPLEEVGTVTVRIEAVPTGTSGDSQSGQVPTAR